MTNFQLKILALIFMTIDHIGYFFNHNSLEYISFRAIGRLSFPIFLFLIVQGYNHTSNIKKYLFALYSFAIISILPFYYAFGSYLNIFFTLGNVVLMLYLFEFTNNKIVEFLIFIAFFILSIDSDWGIVAIPSIYFSKDILKDNKLQVHLPIYISSIFFINYISQLGIKNINIYNLTTPIIYSIFILLSMCILLQYNGMLGYKLKGLKKYLFYIYYPLHLVVIAYVLK